MQHREGARGEKRGERGVHQVHLYDKKESVSLVYGQSGRRNVFNGKTPTGELYVMCRDISSKFTTITATMISPTFCSKSSIDETRSQASFFKRLSRTSPSRLDLARNSSKLPRPKTRQTIPNRNRSSAPTAALTNPTALF